MNHAQPAAIDLEQISSHLPSYEFQQLISINEHSAVYRARQKSLDRDVAIKVLLEDSIENSELQENFLKRTKAMARLTHPNLIRVFDSGEAAGMLYVVMEYVHGKSLAHSTKGQTVEAKQAVRIVLSVCKGLAYSTKNGVSHGNLSPFKILLNSECEPKIRGFNSSAVNPMYVAPESLKEERSSPNTQSDIFSAATILRELLIGSTSDEEAFRELETRHPKLAEIISLATQSAPTDRYDGFEQLIKHLESWLSNHKSLVIPSQAIQGTPVRKSHSLAAAKPLPKPPSFKPAPAKPVWKKVAVIAGLLCAIHLLWGAYQTKRETLNRLQAEENAKPIEVKVVELAADGQIISTRSEQRQTAKSSSLLVGRTD
ncbi:MAG: serine/threonine-protein kinase [Akkermansiaceae bacterium]